MTNDFSGAARASLRRAAREPAMAQRGQETQTLLG